MKDLVRDTENNGRGAEGTPATLPVSDDGLHCTLPLDQPIYREILDEFVDDISLRLAAMSEALQQDDYDGLAELAHALKGSAGSLGYHAFTEPCRSLESLARKQETEQLGTIVEELRTIAATIVVSVREASGVSG